MALVELLLELLALLGVPALRESVAESAVLQRVLRELLGVSVLPAVFEL